MLLEKFSASPSGKTVPKIQIWRGPTILPWQIWWGIGLRTPPGGRMYIFHFFHFSFFYNPSFFTHLVFAIFHIYVGPKIPLTFWVLETPQMLVIYILQAFSNVILSYCCAATHNIVQLTQRVARSLCDSWASCYTMLMYRFILKDIIQ